MGSKEALKCNGEALKDNEEALRRRRGVKESWGVLKVVDGTTGLLNDVRG